MKIEQVKSAMSEKTTVKYKNISYHITGIIMRLNGSEWVYLLELHDLKANSITIAKLSEANLEGE